MSKKNRKDIDPPAPKLRKRIKGFTKFAHYDNGKDEYVEIPRECPVVSCAGVNLIQVEGGE